VVNTYGLLGESSEAKPETLLFLGSSEPVQLVASRKTKATGFLASVLSCRLDQMLAEGRSPDSGRLLAARAQVLVSRARREEIAECWARLTTRALRPSFGRSARSSLNREAVVSCESEVSELRHLLEREGPISARGVAMASVLLTDGTGPVHSRRFSARHLSDLLRHVARQLEAFDEWSSEVGRTH
jgi:hypothetical protein